MTGGMAIADRALALVGAPFRLGGRDAAHGIDCIGLAALALGDAAELPIGYRLRSSTADRWHDWFEHHGFEQILAGTTPGDLMLVRPGPLHIHLLVTVPGGFVHAHAGLRRTVFLPAPSPWPVESIWRQRQQRLQGRE